MTINTLTILQRSAASPAFGRRAMLGVVGGAMVGGLAAPHVARAAQRTLRFAHNNSPTSQFGQGGAAFAAAVAADPVLGSAFKVEIFDNAQLGDDMSMLKNCKEGTLDGMLIGSSILSNVVPEIGLLNAPYLFRDAEQARHVLDGPLGQEFKDLSKAKDLPVLAWGENGMRHISSNKPVRTIADLHGLKLRVPQSPMMLDGFRAMGADAAPLAFGLLKEALRTGEFQAQENAVVLIEAAKLYEVQKYLCLTGHIYDGIGFIASSDLMEDLTPPQRAAMAACAQKGAVVSRKVAGDGAVEAAVHLKALGMTIIDNVELAGFRAAARPYLDSLGGTYGAARVKSLIEAGA